MWSPLVVEEYLVGDVVLLHYSFCCHRRYALVSIYGFMGCMAPLEVLAAPLKADGVLSVLEVVALLLVLEALAPWLILAYGEIG